jgi:hypothetical protein
LAEIVQRNLGLASSGGSGSVKNKFVEGRKLNAVFAFCDIRKIDNTTKVLQDLTVKGSIYVALCLSVLLYGSEI